MTELPDDYNAKRFGGYDYSDLELLPLESPDTKDIVLCKIMYSEEYRIIMGCMRALMALNELSARALHMTECAIEMVSAHYTVWAYRYKIVEHMVSAEEKSADDHQLKEDCLENELRWCGQVALKNEKNYQIWHYRQRIVELLIKYVYGGDSTKYSVKDWEYPIITEMIDSDEKNYHVWSHLRWLVDRFDLYGSSTQVQFTSDRLADDVRNNSAWNHRYLVLSKKGLGEDVEFVKDKITESPTNPSSWNYLRGIYRKTKKDISELEPFVSKFTSDGPNFSIPALEYLSDIYSQQKETQKCSAIYRQLAGKVDPVRANYWHYKDAQLTH